MIEYGRCQVVRRNSPRTGNAAVAHRRVNQALAMAAAAKSARPVHRNRREVLLIFCAPLFCAPLSGATAIGWAMALALDGARQVGPRAWEMSNVRPLRIDDSNVTQALLTRLLSLRSTPAAGVVPKRSKSRSVRGSACGRSEREVRFGERQSASRQQVSDAPNPSASFQARLADGACISPTSLGRLWRPRSTGRDVIDTADCGPRAMTPFVPSP